MDTYEIKRITQKHYDNEGEYELELNGLFVNGSLFETSFSKMYLEEVIEMHKKYSEEDNKNANPQNI